MPTTIVEDRTLARIAYEAAGRIATSDVGRGVDIAFGHAVIALRIHGISPRPEILHTLRADLEAIFSDPRQMAQARSFTSRAGPAHPANTDRSPAPRRAVA